MISTNQYIKRLFILMTMVFLILILIACQNQDQEDPFPPNNQQDDEVLTLDIFRERYLTHLKQIPTIYLTSVEPVESKDVYVEGTFEIRNAGDFDLEPIKTEIRGRGNSSWTLEPSKRPFRLKFDSRTSIFGYGRMTSWALIPNHSDKSFMRNYLAQALARSLSGMDYNSNVIPVEVYMNGEYLGFYGLTDHMQSNQYRVDVEQYYYDGVTFETGFLIEFDDRADHESEGNILGRDYFTYPLGQWFPNDADHSSREIKIVMKYPKYNDVPYYNQPELYALAFNYVKNYVTQVLDATFYRKFHVFETLADVDSFIDFYLVNELMQNIDAHYLSLLFNKKLDQKMQAGPVWDFDIAAGNAEHIFDVWFHQSANKQRIYETPNHSIFQPVTAGQPYHWFVRNVNPVFKALMEVDDFFDRFYERYQFLYDHKIRFLLNSIMYVHDFFEESAIRNFEKHDILNQYVWPNPETIIKANTYDKQVEFLHWFLSGRAQWMLETLASESLFR
jgi:hypothetical protein